MLIVLADDITGAAEMAGIAHRYGLRVTLTVNKAVASHDADVAVIASDTRSHTAADAVAMTASLTRDICQVFSGVGSDHLLFRKTDSALRGFVAEELQAIIDNSPYSRALYMPANPSKGRTINCGVYEINGTPLSQTPFRDDPEFPALTSRLAERFPGLPYADAVTVSDVEAVVSRHLASAADMHECVLAGAADLFTALVEQLFGLPSVAPHPFSGLSSKASMIVVRGSTLSRRLDLGIDESEMPMGVFDESQPVTLWTDTLLPQYQAAMKREGRRGMVVGIGDKPVRQGKHAAVYLRNTMATVCARMLSQTLPDELIVEGGATAFALLSHTPWTAFTVTDEIAPGVVRCKPVSGDSVEENNTIQITLKPGSYEWGNLWK